MINFGTELYLVIRNPKYQGTHCPYCNQPYTKKEKKYLITQGWFTKIHSEDGYGVELIAEYYDNSTFRTNEIVFGHAYIDNMQELVSLRWEDFESYDEGPYAFREMKEALKWVEEFGNE